MSSKHKAWQVNERDFPHAGDDEEKLAFIVRYAALATSTYNRQPWYYQIKNNVLYLYADRRHALPFSDPDDRALTISCATSLMIARVALRFFGYKDVTELLPNSDDKSLLAAIRIGARIEPEEEYKNLFRAVMSRHMNHCPYKDKPVEDEKIKQLQAAVEAENAWIHICTDEEKVSVARLIAEGDLIQSSNKFFRREMAAWTSTLRHKSDDGIPEEARGFYNTIAALDPQHNRLFQIKGGETVSRDKIAQNCPLMVVIGSKKGGNLERMYAGQAKMRFLLMAEHLGLGVSALNQPVEIPDLRLKLHDEIGGQYGRAQCVMRVGYPTEAPNLTARRPLEDILEWDRLGVDTDDSKPQKFCAWRKLKSLFSR